MKETINLRTPIPTDWEEGTAVQVYTDRGSGTVDLTKPLLPTPYRVAGDGGRVKTGFGHVPYGRGRFGHGRPSRPRTGYGHGRYGHTPYGRTDRFVDVPVSVTPTFGPWKFQVAAVDAAGNVQAAGLFEIIRVVSSTTPPAVRDFAFGSYDSINDQISFNLTLNLE